MKVALHTSGSLGSYLWVIGVIPLGHWGHTSGSLGSYLWVIGVSEVVQEIPKGGVQNLKFDGERGDVSVLQRGLPRGVPLLQGIHN